MGEAGATPRPAAPRGPAPLAVGLTPPPPELEPPGEGFRATVLGRAGSYPAPGEATTGWLLSTPRTHLLIDCGAGVLANLLRVLPFTRLDALLLTHLHPDHVSDLTVLPHLLEFTRWQEGVEPEPLPVYLPPEPAAERERLAATEGAEARVYRAGDDLRLGDLRLRFARAAHPVYTCALRASWGGACFAFTADTGPADAVRQLVAGAELLACEATLPDGRERVAAEIGHLTPSLAAGLATEAGAGRVLLTHLPMGCDEEACARAARRAARRLAGRAVPAFEPARPLRTYAVGGRG